MYILYICTHTYIIYIYILIYVSIYFSLYISSLRFKVPYRRPPNHVLSGEPLSTASLYSPICRRTMTDGTRGAVNWKLSRELNCTRKNTLNFANFNSSSQVHVRPGHHRRGALLDLAQLPLIYMYFF